MIENADRITSLNISGILDTAVKDISKQVVGLTMQDVPAQHVEMEEPCSMSITTQGDYCLRIVLYADGRILRAMAQNMKHGVSADDTDISIYTTEYFNILCGRIVSAMNMKHHSSARFGIPKFVRGAYQNRFAQEPQCRQEYFYNCNIGTIKLETLFQGDLKNHAD
ncbi:MAG: chemotaxis protein CheX [Hungatella sp.]